MKTRIMSVVLTVVMLLALVPMSAFAAGAASLPAAVNGVITLTDDINLTAQQIISTDTIIKGDANGAKITSAVEDLFKVTSGATLTLGENLTIETTESILWANGGTINIEGATLKSTHASHALGFASNGGVINMKSGSVNSKWTSLTASGTNSKVNISGGSIVSTDSNVAISKNDAIVTISGGSSTSLTTANFAALWGRKDSTYTGNAGKFVVTGGTISGKNAISLENASTAELSGGNYTGTVAVQSGCDLDVSGGTFDDINVLSYLTDDADVDVVLTKDATLSKAVNIKGKVDIKATSAAKLNVTAEDALTVTGEINLGENLTVEGTDSVLWAKGGTININGAALKSTHTGHALGFASNGGEINMNSGSINSYWTSLTASGAESEVNVNGGTLVSTNSNVVLAKDNAVATISGGSNATLTTENFAALWSKNGGKLVVNGGAISGKDAISTEANASAEVTGGNLTGLMVVGTGSTLKISGGIINGDVAKRDGATNATIEITGGTFTDDVTEYLPDNLNQGVDGTVYSNKSVTIVNGTASADIAVKGDVICIDADDIIGGKHFMYWEIIAEDGSAIEFVTGGRTTEIASFKMPNCNVTIKAVYRAVLPMFMHSIIVVDSDYGTTSPTGIMLVMQGLSHKFTFTPDEGCEIVDVLINGESVGAVDSYRLTVNEFVNTVEAIYAPITDADA